MQAHARKMGCTAAHHASAGLQANGPQVEGLVGHRGAQSCSCRGVVVVGASHAHRDALKHNAVQSHGVGGLLHCQTDHASAQTRLCTGLACIWVLPDTQLIAGMLVLPRKQQGAEDGSLMAADRAPMISHARCMQGDGCWHHSVSAGAYSRRRHTCAELHKGKLLLVVDIDVDHTQPCAQAGQRAMLEGGNAELLSLSCQRSCQHSCTPQSWENAVRGW